MSCCSVLPVTLVVIVQREGIPQAAEAAVRGYVGFLLNCEEFTNLAEARWFARRRKEERNEDRPHSSLGDVPPG